MPLTVEISISEDLASEPPGAVAPEPGDYCQGCQAVGQCRDTCLDDVPEMTLLQTWASAAYLEKRSAIASIRVATLEEIQQLNKQYRDKDKTTNVLSFPMQLPEEIASETATCLLGDIALCAGIINREAKQQAIAINAHWAHMVVHGMLHLQGFDHIENEQATIMEQMEIKILDQLGFKNPYK